MSSGRGGRDLAASSAAAAIFSMSLGMAGVALPLLALRTGYSLTEVGLLTAVSAVTQMVTRLAAGPAMRRWEDRTLVAAAALSLALSCGALVVSAALVPFLVAEALQGAARAFFWTGSQTHVVRGPGRAIGALAVMNFSAAAGALVGPVLAGFLSGDSPVVALGAAATLGLAATGPVALMDRLPPFVPAWDRPAGRVWQRPGVAVGSSAGVTAGAWASLMTSYVPVLLAAAEQSPGAIGVGVAVANAASVLGAVLTGRLPRRWTVGAVLLGMLVTGAGLAAAAVTAAWPVLSTLALAVSGVGAGVLQTVGPAAAAESVGPEERGDAIAAAGTFRAAALLFTPLLVAGLLSVVTLAPAMAIAGGTVALPVLALLRVRRRFPGVAGEDEPGR